MTTALLQIDKLSKHFGALAATDEVDLQVNPGQIHALIGPNGAGKTTLINQIAGEMAPESGTIRFDGHLLNGMPVHHRTRLGMARTYQIANILNGFSALDNVILAIQACQGHSFRFWRSARSDHARCDQALGILSQVGLATRARVSAGRLSHGEQRQLGVAIALGAGPKLLLLDEPMAGLGSAATRRMIALLRQLREHHAILLVEHDMNAVFRLADRITVLVYGRVVASGAPSDIRRHPEVREAYLGQDTPANPATEEE